MQRQLLEEQEKKQLQEQLVINEKHFRTLFNFAPVAFWEEDASELYEYIEELKDKGIKDFDQYFTQKPEEIRNCYFS